MIFPEGLKKGCNVGIIAPSGGANLEYIDFAIENIQKLGLNVVEGSNIRNMKYLASGTRRKKSK